MDKLGLASQCADATAPIMATVNDYYNYPLRNVHADRERELHASVEKCNVIIVKRFVNDKLTRIRELSFRASIYNSTI